MEYVVNILVSPTATENFIRFMMTSLNAIKSALLSLCERNPPFTGGFPSQRPVTRSFDVFFDLHLDKWLSKQSRHPLSETPSRSL